MADDRSTIASSSRPGTPTATRPNPLTPGPSTLRQPVYRFAWDLASRRVGPGSVADTIDSRADFLDHTGGPGPYSAHNQFNLSSLSLAAAAIPPEWSSAKYGLNAISTVLNHPRKKSDPPKAHLPVPPIKPAILPRVKRKDFDAYLRAVTPEWDKYQRNKLEGKQGIAQLHPHDIRPFRASKEIPLLDSVPAVYFDSPFELSKPATFAKVIEQQEGQELADPSSLSHSLPLLEKMSHYADTIELHLIREISQRSSSFFEALSNLQELQTESEQCLERIARLREMLHDVDEKGAKRGLRLVRMRKRLKNLQEVQEGLKVLENAEETVSLTRGLVSGGDWSEALNFIDGLHDAWGASPAEASSIHSPPVIPPPRTSSLPVQLDTVAEGEEREEGANQAAPSTPPIHLSTLKAFVSLPTQLQALSLQISSALTKDLVITFRSGLHLSLSAKGGSPKTSDAEPSQDSSSPDMRDRLTPLLQGLIRTKNHKNGVLALRGVALEECRSAMKQYISLADPGVLPEGSEGSVEFTKAFIQRVQAQSQQDFIQLMSALFDALIRFLRVLQSQHNLIFEIFREEMKSGDTIGIPALEAEAAESLSDASDLANVQVSKVLNLRAEQHSSLDLPTFVNLFDTVWTFVIACEVICRKMFVGLRGAILAQSKSFLTSFHAQRLSQSAKVVEEELWAPAEVNRHSQTIVNLIVDGAVQDPPSFKLQGTTVVEPPQSNGTPTSPTSPNGNAKPEMSSKFVYIENRTFYAVGATLQVLSLVTDYLKVIVNLPVLILDTMSRMVELLKSFNSRTCQVVLGAGAMRSAGLKNITAKHLALASQSLSIMIALVPYIRETFRRHLNAKQAVMLIEFDKLKRDYQEHQNEIHDKLIAIMGDRIAFHCKTLASIDWPKVSQPSPNPPVVNDYMEQLIKETTTLAKVLSRYLPEPPVEYIMSQIFAAINHNLEEEYGKIELPNERAKEMLLTDVRYLKTKISALKGVGNVSGMGMLELIVSEKRSKTVAVPSSVASPAVSSPSVTPATPALPSSSPPPSTPGIGMGLPSSVRRSPFAGNKRISSLLSSVTAIGRVAEKPDPSGKLPLPIDPPREKKVPLVEEPESIPISSSESLDLGDRALNSKMTTPDTDESGRSRQSSNPALPASPGPLTQHATSEMNGTIPEEHGPADPDPESSSVPPPPAPPPKQQLVSPLASLLHPPPTPGKELLFGVPLPPTPSAPEPPSDVVTNHANGIEMIPESN